MTRKPTSKLLFRQSLLWQHRWTGSKVRWRIATKTLGRPSWTMKMNRRKRTDREKLIKRRRTTTTMASMKYLSTDMMNYRRSIQLRSFSRSEIICLRYYRCRIFSSNNVLMRTTFSIFCHNSLSRNMDMVDRINH